MTLTFSKENVLNIIQERIDAIEEIIPKLEERVKEKEKPINSLWDLFLDMFGLPDDSEQASYVLAEAKTDLDKFRLLQSYILQSDPSSNFIPLSQSNYQRVFMSTTDLYQSYLTYESL
jgi:hypothetical protein